MPLHGIMNKVRTNPSIQDILRNHGKQLEQALNLDPTCARIEVQCLLQAVLLVDRAHLLAHPEQPLGNEQQLQFDELFERRLSGEPIAYLIGEREFFGLTFKVTSDTLIPRPETELLVELALQRVPQQGKFRMLDLGTGCGAIALSIAHARPDAEVVAVETSTAALEVARYNARCLDLRNVRLLLGDWFEALQEECFDLIVANPPYIAAGDTHLTRGDVRFEPPIALSSGADGLEAINRITAQAGKHLDVDGWLLLEHGYDQASRVRALLHQTGFDRIFSARDLAGTERVSGGARSASTKTAG